MGTNDRFKLAVGYQCSNDCTCPRRFNSPDDLTIHLPRNAVAARQGGVRAEQIELPPSRQQALPGFLMVPFPTDCQPVGLSFEALLLPLNKITRR